MYAVIRAGGRQHRVSKGDVIEVDGLKDEGATLEFTPLLVVDDKGKTRAGRSDLSKARVTGTVVAHTKGPKIDVVRYRNKTRYRRHSGHRQKYSSVQISDIKLTAGRSSKKSDAEGKKDGS